ncbi:MAG: radical SAM protein [Pirellulaceae bacterium]|nr:radical SAM protein [Pirellulaceae bacterium]
MSVTDWARSLAKRHRRPRRDPPQPPFPDLQPTVEWQVNGFCNYDCTYCIQSAKSRVGVPTDSTVRSIVTEFAKLPGVWEIKMSGGEPFAFKGFVNSVIPQLTERTRHLISVLTNFSAPIDVLEKFCQLTADRLRITSASLHPDSTSAEDFIEKAIAYRELRQRYNPASSFVVNVVLVPGYVANHVKYRDQIEAAGLRYFPQLMKIKGGVYPYPPTEMALIEQLTHGSHDPSKVNRSPNYQGLHCEAGVWYFTVDQTGEAFSCRTGKRFLAENDQARLGNLTQGTFQLRKQGGPCPYTICPCTVPVNRGIVRLPNQERQQLILRKASENNEH